MWNNSIIYHKIIKKKPLWIFKGQLIYFWTSAKSFEIKIIFWLLNFTYSNYYILVHHKSTNKSTPSVNTAQGFGLNFVANFTIWSFQHYIDDTIVHQINIANWHLSCQMVTPANETALFCQFIDPQGMFWSEPKS